ncbi:hypothetical protein ATCC90586_011103 [Pythium insidiosum]|nr:hypothetical protein ATCC90586_011103 [Pythium insidiosum]
MKIATILALSTSATLATISAVEASLPYCSHECPDVLKPVCGSNDVTYDNDCYFNVAKCLMGGDGKNLYIKHEGQRDVNSCEFDQAKCKLGDAGKDLFIKHNGPCRRELANVAVETCNTGCAEIYAPVCGSNDVSYDNECYFNVAKCKLGDAGKDLTIKHDGECGDTVKRALRAEIGCDIGCIDVYEPVCGSDMITYRNTCELRVARCTTKDPTLVVLYDGVCRR